MRPDARAFDAIGMDRDRGNAPGITKPVDLFKPGRGETSIAQRTRGRAGSHGFATGVVESVEGFGERAFQHRISAPRVVRVRRTELTGRQNDRQERETAGRIAAYGMAGIAAGARNAPLRDQEVR